MLSFLRTITMQPCWNFYVFDYARYLILRPLLRVADTPDAFVSLLDRPEADGIDYAVAEALVQVVEEATISLEQARNAFVFVACCISEPLPVEATFPRFVAALARRGGAEDAAETLGALVSGGRPFEDWMRDPQGLIGWLTPEETGILARDCKPLLEKRGRSMASVGRGGRRVRRGGLLGGCVRFVRHLFNSGPLPDDVLRLLGRLLQEAHSENYGLAVTAA